MSNFMKGFKVKYKTRSPWHVHEKEEHFRNKEDAEGFADEQKKTSESLGWQVEPPKIEEVAFIVIDSEVYCLGTSIKLR